VRGKGEIKAKREAIKKKRAVKAVLKSLLPPKVI
jgi:hypothetical protein